MDEDQSIRRRTPIFLNKPDKDYYEFEAHIFFDDAFQAHKDDEYNFTVNNYVRLLIDTVEFSGRFVVRGMFII